MTHGVTRFQEKISYKKILATINWLASEKSCNEIYKNSYNSYI